MDTLSSGFRVGVGHASSHHLLCGDHARGSLQWSCHVGPSGPHSAPRIFAPKRALEQGGAGLPIFLSSGNVTVQLSSLYVPPRLLPHSPRVTANSFCVTRYIAWLTDSLSSAAFRFQELAVSQSSSNSSCRTNESMSMTDANVYHMYDAILCFVLIVLYDMPFPANYFYCVSILANKFDLVLFSE